MQPLFISATGTNVGKTHTTLRLIEVFAARGLKVGAFKPIETGVAPVAHDASLLLEACQKVNEAFKGFAPEEITAYTFPLPAAPFCADTYGEIAFEKIMEKFHELSALCDILLVEGAGGLMVPVTKDLMMIDLAERLSAKTLLVTPSKLGCINETLLSMKALKENEIEFDWCVNIYEDKESFAEVTQPYYDAAFPEWWSVEEGLERFVSSLITTEH